MAVRGRFVKFNWKLSGAYLLFAAGIGWSIGLSGELSAGYAVGVGVVVALLRMVFDGLRS